jgi:hypothetical protein
MVLSSSDGKAKAFARYSKTTFHVIDGEFLLYHMLLGVKTIHEHGILKFAGFGGRAIHPRKSTGECAYIHE